MISYLQRSNVHKAATLNCVWMWRAANYRYECMLFTSLFVNVQKSRMLQHPVSNTRIFFTFAEWVGGDFVTQPSTLV